METFNPIPPILNRAAAMIASACLILPATAGEPANGGNLSEREQSRRSAAIQEAQELLVRGDDAYQAGRYAEAVEAYAGARESFPKAPISAELRAAATDRYAQASVEYARQLSKKGDVAGAKAAVDKVLLDEVAPQNAGALAMRAQLDDPIRTNPAITAEHVKDINTVRQQLYTAEGAFNLGKFDEAKATYQKVLRIDPTNIAARRGMEQVASAISGYQKAAYDHTRSEMLSQVGAAWETALTAPDLDPNLVDPTLAANTSLGPVSLATKLDQIIIPKIALDQTSIQEALDFLRIKSAEYDLLEADSTRRGVNFALDTGAADSEGSKRILGHRFDLKLNHVPLSKALKYLTEATQTTYSTDDFSVVIKPIGSVSDKLISRSYRVPPDFITSLSDSAPGEDPAAADPFADSAPKKALLTTRLSAKEALTKQGIPFPEGTSANYSSGNNTLTVVNTPNHQDMIDQLVQAMTLTEPVMVSVQVTMIKVQQTHLEELGFDWLLNPVPLNSDGSVFGSGGTVGNGSPRTGADVISPVNYTSLGGVPTLPGAPVNPGLMTNGLRSGDYAIGRNSLDNIVNDIDRSSQQSSVAPGVIAVTGLFTDGQVQMVMRGLNQKKGVDILSKPSVITRSNQQASISILREFIYPTEYEPPQIPTSVGNGQSAPVTPATPTAFEKKDVGIQLEVLPVADADKRFVDITLSPSFSDFDGFVNYGSPINSTQGSLLGSLINGPSTVELTKNAILMPVFSMNKLNTQLSVADGATIAIGGLLGESIQNVNDSVPILGGIPWIGRLFSSEAKEPVSTAIIFLVHVELLDPTGRPYRDR